MRSCSLQGENVYAKSSSVENLIAHCHIGGLDYRGRLLLGEIEVIFEGSKIEL